MKKYINPLFKSKSRSYMGNASEAVKHPNSKCVLTNYLKNQGREIGHGCERVAFTLPSQPNYVFKVLRKKNEQQNTERSFLADIPEDLAHLIPEYEYYGRVVKMGKVQVIEDFINTQCNNEIIDEQDCCLLLDNLEDATEWLREKGYIKTTQSEINNFLCWFDDNGGDSSDFWTNMENVGFNADKELQFIDLGWSAKISN